MLRVVWQSIGVTVALGLMVCGFYPLLVTLVGQGFFQQTANGSLVGGKEGYQGSQLLGQQFASDKYFWGRPSSAGTGYDPMASGASNLGPTSRVLYERLEESTRMLVQRNIGLNRGDIPVDLVTSSASGLDPHISPASAFVQAKRVAQARQIPLEGILTLVERHTQLPQWGIFGEKTVNVLLLNLELDRLMNSNTQKL